MSVPEEGKSSSLEQEIEKLKNPGNISAELTKLLEKKTSIEQRLMALEKQIYALEGSYLQDTRSLGNILTGWDSYLSSRGSGALKRPMKFKESDRLFSLSSVTSMKNADMKGDKQLSLDKEDGSPLSGGFSDNEEERPPKQQKIKTHKGPGRPRKTDKKNVVVAKTEDDEYVDV